MNKHDIYKEALGRLGQRGNLQEYSEFSNFQALPTCFIAGNHTNEWIDLISPLQWQEGYDDTWLVQGRGTLAGCHFAGQRVVGVVALLLH